MNAIRKLIEWGQRQRLIPELAQVADAAEAELRDYENTCDAAGREIGRLQGQLAERDRADAELLKVLARYKRFPAFDTDVVALARAVDRWAAAKGGGK